MANLKNITDVPVVESAEGLNLIVNDNGAAKQIAANAVGVKSYNDLEDKPCYTEVDNEGNETVHKLDAKYLPEYDAVISITNDGNTLVSGSNASVAAKLKQGEIPRILIKSNTVEDDGVMNISAEHPSFIFSEFENEHATEAVIMLSTDTVGELVILPDDTVVNN